MYTNTYKYSSFPRLGSASGTHRPSHQRRMAMSTSRVPTRGAKERGYPDGEPFGLFFLSKPGLFFWEGRGKLRCDLIFDGCIFVDDIVQIL